MALALKTGFDRLNNRIAERLPGLFARYMARVLPIVRRFYEEQSLGEVQSELVEMAVPGTPEYQIQGELARLLREELEKMTLDDDIRGLVGADRERWIAFESDVDFAIGDAFAMAYEDGLQGGFGLVQRRAFDRGLTDQPEVVGVDWKLIDPHTLREIQDKAATLVTRVSDGTKYYLREAILRGVKDGLASPDIADKIKAGEGLADILGSGRFKYVLRYTEEALRGMSIERIDSIVNTEINRAETDGRLAQWAHMGLKKKRWKHTGPADQCQYCLGNERKGFIGMDEMFDSVWGPATIQGPPAHPSVCHCHIEFDEDEMEQGIDKLEDPWTGGDGRDRGGLAPEEPDIPPPPPPDLDTVLAAADRVDLELRKSAIRGWMRETVQEAQPYRRHNMAKSQKGRYVRFRDMELVYGNAAKSEEAVVETLLEWTLVHPDGTPYNDLPAPLADVTRRIYFTHQASTKDPALRRKYKSQFTTLATGGDGDIVVYRNNKLIYRNYAHEAGHNYANVRYGDTSPRPGTDFYKAHQAWKEASGDDLAFERVETPVRKYGQVNVGEDFATSIELYATNPGYMERAYPVRFDIISRLFSDPGYRG